jgi:hypothetical protein
LFCIKTFFWICFQNFNNFLNLSQSRQLLIPFAITKYSKELTPNNISQQPKPI